MFSYLDAGTGSMLMAAFAGGAAGIGVLVRMYWPPDPRRLLQEAQAQAAEESFGELMGKTPTDT